MFYYEERGEGRVVIEMIVRLQNVWGKLLEINQIASIFTPNLVLSANVALNIVREH